MALVLSTLFYLTNTLDKRIQQNCVILNNNLINYSKQYLLFENIILRS